MFEGLGVKLGGEIGLLSFLLVLLILIHQYLYPFFKKKVLHRENSSIKRLNPNTTHIAEVTEAVKYHELMDEKRSDEMKESLKEIQKTLTDHEARLRVLEYTRK